MILSFFPYSVTHCLMQDGCYNYLEKKERKKKKKEGRKWNFPGGSVDKNPPTNAGNMGLKPGLGRFHMPRSRL